MIVSKATELGPEGTCFADPTRSTNGAHQQYGNPAWLDGAVASGSVATLPYLRKPVRVDIAASQQQDNHFEA